MDTETEEQVVDLGAWPVLDLTHLPPEQLTAVVGACDLSTATERQALGMLKVCERMSRYFDALQVRAIARAATLATAQVDDTVEDPFTGVDMTAAELAPLHAVTKTRANQRYRPTRG